MHVWLAHISALLANAYTCNKDLRGVASLAEIVHKPQCVASQRDAALEAIRALVEQTGGLGSAHGTFHIKQRLGTSRANTLPVVPHTVY